MKHVILVVFLFTSWSAYGQSPSLSEEIVVTASAVPETVETTPAAVTVITREEIERREARDVADVLREVPGVAVSRTGSAGKITGIFLRGGSTKQALVLWNGVELNNAYLSAYNFGQLATAGVERVEVVRGPFSALYGADAVSGVINVLTVPGGAAFTGDVEGGENGLRNGAVAGSLQFGGWNAHGSIEVRRDDGFAPNDDFSSDSFSGGLLYQAGSRFSVGVLARRSTYDLGIPRNANAEFTAFVPTPNRREEGTESQIAIPARFSLGGTRFEARLTENRRDDDFVDPDAPFGGAFATTQSRTRNLRASAQRNLRSIGTLTFGAELESAEAEHADSFGLDVDRRVRDSKAVFIEDRLSIRTGSSGSLELTAGARYDEYESFGSEISPRLAMAWLTGANKFRAAYGQAFRAPAVGELYVPFFGNPDLDSERSSSYEIGYDRFFTGSTMLSVTAFRGAYDDLIAYDGIANRFANIESATAQGLELGLTGRAGALSGSVSYTWLDAEDDQTGQRLLRRPEHSGSVAIGYDFDPLSVGIVVLHTGVRPDVTDLVPFGRVTNDAFTTADLTLSYDSGSMKPYVKVENAADERYEEVFGYPSARRRVIAGVRFTR